MKKVICLIVILISFQSSKARKVNGYFVDNNNDTIQAVFRLKTVFREELDLSSCSKFIRYSAKNKIVQVLNPADTKFVKIKDGSIGEYDIYPVQLDQLRIFALCLVKGPLSVYKSQAYGAKYVVNRPSQSGGTTYCVQLTGRPIAVNSLTPFDEQFWIGYLGDKYAEFTDCLKTDVEERIRTKAEGNACFFDGKSFKEIAEEFNKRYPN